MWARSWTVLAMIAAMLVGMSMPAVAQTAPPAPPPPSASPAPAPSAPPPILLLVRADARVPTPTVAEVEAALQALLRGSVRRRSVESFAEPLRALVLACGDPACLGAQIAAAGGIGAIEASLVRGRRRDEVLVSIRLLEPVSGATRGMPIELTLTSTTAPRAAIEAVAEQVRAVLPAPPPLTSLLIAVSVEGAAVTVDGESRGTSPLAPLDVSPGRHTIQVSHPETRGASSVVDIQPGEAARIDVTLEPDAAAAARAAQARDARLGNARGGAGPWYSRWYVLAVGGAVVVGAAVAGVLILTRSSGPGFEGVGVPPIE